MAKKRKKAPRHHHIAPKAPPREHDTSEWERAAENQPLMRDLKKAVYSDFPGDLLGAVSGLVVTTEPSTPMDDPAVSLAELTETFLGTNIAPTTAALHVAAELIDDDDLATTIRRELLGRTQPMPAWVRQLPETRISTVYEMREPLRHGENYLLDVRIPGAGPMPTMIYVDNNLGQVVKDAFSLPVQVEEVLDRVAEEDELRVTPVDPAWARARLEKALTDGARLVPPLETDTWPMLRPLVRWLLRLLPVGAELDDPEPWSDDEKHALIEAFLASGYGRGFDDDVHRGLLSSLIWLGTSYGTLDPLDWNEATVEHTLLDRFPRKVVVPVDELEKLPDLLRAFIRYAHHEKGHGPRLTRDVLAAVDALEADYLDLLHDTGRPGGPQALAQALLAAQESGTGLDGLDDEQRAQLISALLEAGEVGPENLAGPAGAGGLADLLAASVGGPEVFEELDIAPLPDEPFDDAGIAPDVRTKAGETLAMCDRVADKLLDVEHRTAQRRLLGDLLRRDPSLLRGNARTHTTAAAISWLVVQANGATATRGVLIRDLLAEFGVKNVTSRVERMTRVLDVLYGPGPAVLGSPRYLVAEHRERLLRYWQTTD